MGADSEKRLSLPDIYLTSALHSDSRVGKAPVQIDLSRTCWVTPREDISRAFSAILSTVLLYYLNSRIWGIMCIFKIPFPSPSHNRIPYHFWTQEQNLVVGRELSNFIFVIYLNPLEKHIYYLLMYFSIASSMPLTSHSKGATCVIALCLSWCNQNLLAWVLCSHM